MDRKMAFDHVAVIKFHHLVFIFLWLQAASLMVKSSTDISKPRCVNKCGNVSIPYPFGIGGNDCYMDDLFRLICDESFTPPKPFMGDFEILDIELDGQFRTTVSVASDCYDKNGKPEILGFTSFRGTFKRFTFSNTRNKLVAIGCDTVAYIRGNNSYISGCVSSCTRNSINYMINGSCAGIGCCQSPIPAGLTTFFIYLSAFNNHTEVHDFNPCSYAFLVEENRFNFSSLDLYDNQNRSKVPVVIDWAVGNEKCEEAKKNSTGTYLCGVNTNCYNPSNNNEYRCNCSDGFKGNPYLIDGCQDIDECKNQSLSPCVPIATCYNKIGDYNCSCPRGYHGDGRKSGSGCQDIDECANQTLNQCVYSDKCLNQEGSYSCRCPRGYDGNGRKDGDGCFCPWGYHGNGRKDGDGCDRETSTVWIKVTLGIGLSLLFLVLISTWVYWGLKKRKLVQMKEKFFEQNGGLMLKKIIEGHDHDQINAKIFTAEELKKATNNYDESLIIGSGGFGTVYKGILTGKTTVAIKRSKIVDNSQIEQFVNEMVVLSQINHRNVVKLLGCCLETEVPLLVYEFVTNGTLFQHLHEKGCVLLLSWDDRLRIASEIATSLSYLHSEASIPIIHRDVKSSNILLDDKYTAKVADFGASRLVPLDHTQLSTLVQGTLGYLDPEYFHTSQLTEKSDVYSFGVLLAELLTGEKALSYERQKEEINLAVYFISAMKQDRVFQILEDHLVNEGNVEQLQQVAELTKRCLRVEGEKRPTMKEVSIILDGLRRSVKYPGVLDNEPNNEENVHLLGETSNFCTGNVDQYDSLSIELFPVNSGR